MKHILNAVGTEKSKDTQVRDDHYLSKDQLRVALWRDARICVSPEFADKVFELTKQKASDQDEQPSPWTIDYNLIHRLIPSNTERQTISNILSNIVSSYPPSSPVEIPSHLLPPTIVSSEELSVPEAQDQPKFTASDMTLAEESQDHDWKSNHFRPSSAPSSISTQPSKSSNQSSFHRKLRMISNPIRPATAGTVIRVNTTESKTRKYSNQSSNKSLFVDTRKPRSYRIDPYNKLLIQKYKMSHSNTTTSQEQYGLYLRSLQRERLKQHRLKMKYLAEMRALKRKEKQSRPESVEATVAQSPRFSQEISQNPIKLNETFDSSPINHSVSTPTRPKSSQSDRFSRSKIYLNFNNNSSIADESSLTVDEVNSTLKSQLNLKPQFVDTGKPRSYQINLHNDLLTQKYKMSHSNTITSQQQYGLYLRSYQRERLKQHRLKMKYLVEMRALKTKERQKRIQEKQRKQFLENNVMNTVSFDETSHQATTFPSASPIISYDNNHHHHHQANYLNQSNIIQEIDSNQAMSPETVEMPVRSHSLESTSTPRSKTAATATVTFSDVVIVKEIPTSSTDSEVVSTSLTPTPPPTNIYVRSPICRPVSRRIF